MYIVIDGIDGSGKSSLIANLTCKLQKLGYIPINLVEPSYGEYGQKVREILSSSTTRDIGQERQLFTQDRVDHVARTIEPLLALSNRASQFCIIQDRGYLSYPAYQAVNEAEIDAMLDQHIKIAPKPDYFFILDLPPETALKRIAEGRTEASLLEKLEVLKKARERYLSMPDRLGNHVVVINANREPDLIANEILGLLEKHNNE